MAAALLLVVVAVVCAMVVRRWVLTSLWGAFDCHLRVSDSGVTTSGGNWRMGVARFEPTKLAFFVTTSLRWWPTLTIERARLAVIERRAATDELPGVGAAMIVRCRYDDRPVELGMDERAAGAFDAWVGSSPPDRGPDLTGHRS